MARRKITEPEDLPGADELPTLTEQQMDWVRARLAGANATDAYRQAYDTTNMAPRTVWAEASRLNTDPNVAAWLAAARMACLDTAKMTLDSHCAELARLREIALATGNVGAAVQAEQIRGKASGLHVERFEDVTTFDPMATLERLRAISPQAARDLAAQYDIKLIDLVPNTETAGA